MCTFVKIVTNGYSHLSSCMHYINPLWFISFYVHIPCTLQLDVNVDNAGPQHGWSGNADVERLQKENEELSDKLLLANATVRLVDCFMHTPYCTCYHGRGWCQSVLCAHVQQLQWDSVVSYKHVHSLCARV